MSTWTCDSCTYINNSSGSGPCEACGVPRPPSSASAAAVAAARRRQQPAGLGMRGLSGEGAPLLGGDDAGGAGHGAARAADDDGHGGPNRMLNECCDQLKPTHSQWAVIACVLLFIVIIVFACSWATLDVNEMGLTYNSWTGSIDFSETVSAGRYCIGPGQGFVVFPYSAVLLEFSQTPWALAPPIAVRTGRDAGDVDSGGQPMKVSIAFWYRLRPTQLAPLYQKFAMEYQTRFIQFTQQAISDIVQHYQPNQFWSQREAVTLAMGNKVRSVLNSYYADVINFQLLKLEFLPKFEDTIIGIQLMVQTRTTQEYYQSVVTTLKRVDIMAAAANATIVAIDARAQATATLLLNGAYCRSLNITQGQKAVSYGEVGSSLALDSAALIQYIRIRTMKTHSPANLTLGLTNPFPST